MSSEPDSTTVPALGERIRAARRAQRLTQDQLARAVGVTRSAVAQWETGRAGQVGGNLARIARALGTSAEFLLTGQDRPAAPPIATRADEMALLRAYADCTPEDQALLLRTAVRLARREEA
ncbi:Helix-turn-helix domain-containing protein [Rhodovastum atsumiense]|uniref:Helix-turn-helix domain-containing protein n=1 Tax=Rhodovastum atsumiense TaxID=504468 RepID=A0A5M6IVN6_9PROT|nr:helix-turn-helix domain-containing protein [Rhodovastum atsumiense]KAA5612380.1 helix-turn-helix domain-containing protein [Rhodovastum atsumiense]CAH2600281.1 Helix-turn-helix domain-containing protein [Rhodovastum atsumiense]